MSFEKLFKQTKGQPIIYQGRELVLIDRISIAKTQKIRVEFIETNSKWKQGIILKTKGEFVMDNGSIVPNRPVLWEDTAPKKIEAVIKTKNKELIVYNVWDLGDGVIQHWHNGAAMEIKQISENKRIYYCNDGYPDSDFNDLIFSVEWE
jgi:hypothetical protein